MHVSGQIGGDGLRLRCVTHKHPMDSISFSDLSQDLKLLLSTC